MDFLKINFKINTIAIWTVFIAVICVLVFPWLLTLSGVIDFTQTGQIGDTIGGITAPVVGLASAILLYLALKAQVDTNKHQDTLRYLESERRRISIMLNEIKTSIDNFTYQTLDEDELGSSSLPTYKGSEAIYKLFDDYICKFHLNSNEETLYTNPKLSELLGILELFDVLFVTIYDSEIDERRTYRDIAIHQFEYRLFPRLRSDYPNSLGVYYCDGCQMEHGFPDIIVKKIKSIMNCVSDPEL